MMRAKLMNEELYARAKYQNPQFFENKEVKVILNNGVCVKSDCRNLGVLSFMAEVAERTAARAGYTHLMTPIAAPEAMHVALKRGYKILSQITYIDPGAPYALDPDTFLERKKLTRFRDNCEPKVILVAKTLYVH